MHLLRGTAAPPPAAGAAAGEAIKLDGLFAVTGAAPSAAYEPAAEALDKRAGYDTEKRGAIEAPVAVEAPREVNLGNDRAPLAVQAAQPLRLASSKPVAQRPLGPLVSFSFFANTSVLLLSGGPLIGVDGHQTSSTSSCAAYSLSLCNSLGLGFDMPGSPPFVCASTPHTPEGGRPAPPFGSRVLYVTTSLSHLGPGSFKSTHQPAPCSPTSWTPSRSRSMSRPAGL